MKCVEVFEADHEVRREKDAYAAKSSSRRG